MASASSAIYRAMECRPGGGLAGRGVRALTTGRAGGPYVLGLRVGAAIGVDGGLKRRWWRAGTAAGGRGSRLVRLGSGDGGRTPAAEMEGWTQ